MVRPTKPKEMKPKTDAASGSSGGDGNKLLIINSITTILICIVFIGSNYFIQNNLLTSKLNALQAEKEEDLTEEHVGEQVEKGLILDLGEFILNLSDINSRRYLKVNVAVELTKSPHDPDLNAAPTGGGGHGGHGAAAPNPMEIIEKEMSQYKPAIRDAIISILSSKTGEELANVAGKEISKEQIEDAVNAIFAGEREVIRVSFGNFIIQ